MNYPILMRIYGNPIYAKRNLEAGRCRSRKIQSDFNGEPLRPPLRGTLLKTLRVTDHVRGISYTVTLHQGDRLNNIEPRLFGKPFFETVSVGFDEFFRVLRKKWALRWLIA